MRALGRWSFMLSMGYVCIGVSPVCCVAQSRQPVVSGQCLLRITVRDIASKRPVPGVTLLVMVRGVAERRNRMVVSDERGAASVTVPRRAMVSVYAGNFGRPGRVLLDDMWLARAGARSVRVARNTSLTVPVRLLQTRDVIVHVTDEEGKPVANALVRAGSFATRTSAVGRAAVKVPMGASSALVTAIAPSRDSRGSVKVSRADTSVSIQLKPAVNVEGQVLDGDGKPVANLALMLMPVLPGGVAPDTIALESVQTDAQGRFTAKLFPGSTYQAYWQRQGDIKMGQAELNVSADGKTEPVRVARLVLDEHLFEGSVCRSPTTKCGRISSFALDSADNILVCDEEGSRVLKVSPADQLLARWQLDFRPEAIGVRPDGTILVAGNGHLALLRADGSVLRRGKVPGGRAVSAVASNGSTVVVCASGDAGFSVYRMNDDFSGPKRIISGLSGCCGQMDLCIHEGHIYVAENTRFTVGKYTLDGRKVASYTHSDPRKPAYYGDGCCEPKNICFGPDGTMYAAASSAMEVRQYTADGKFIGVVGKLPDADGSCVRVTVGVTRDGSRVYLLDTANNCVRLLKGKASS